MSDEKHDGEWSNEWAHSAVARPRHLEFNRPIGLFEFVRLQRQLGELVGHQVDLVTAAALKPQLRDRILHEAVVAA